MAAEPESAISLRRGEARASIAVLGWGSLIWNVACLRIKTKWRRDGPMLPIEFARRSRNGRLTLVIHPGVKPQTTYWAISDLRDLRSARVNLQNREECTSLDAIAFCSLITAARGVQPEVLSSVRNWLSARPSVDAVIWTGLTQNWQDKFQTDFSVESAVNYLSGMEAHRASDEEKFALAKEYVTKAPPSIQTEVRTRMREKGWFDAQLPSALFEEDEG